jgi:preprotein translocase subunit SecD
MKATHVLKFLSLRGPNTTVHATVVALMATAAFMVATSSGMGPIAPIFFALSLYLVFAAATLELALGSFALIRYLARVGLRRRSP